MSAHAGGNAADFSVAESAVKGLHQGTIEGAEQVTTKLRKACVFWLPWRYRILYASMRAFEEQVGCLTLQIALRTVMLCTVPRCFDKLIEATIAT